MEKLELDVNLLAKAFIEDAVLFVKEIDEKLNELGFKADGEKIWICQLVLNYLLLPEVQSQEDKVLLISRLEDLDKLVTNPSIKKYKSSDYFDSHDEITKNSKKFLKLIFLCMAKNTYEISLLTLKQGDYREAISLMNTARYAFNLYQDAINKSIEKSLFAKANAFKRHIETYELKNQAIDHWCKNIDFKLSNEKAAEILSKIVPVSHRKLSQYVAEAKKKNIHPASKV